VIRARGVPITIRDTRGRDIEAACGQLHAQLAGRDLPRPEVAMLAGVPMAPAVRGTPG